MLFVIGRFTFIFTVSLILIVYLMLYKQVEASRYTAKHCLQLGVWLYGWEFDTAAELPRLYHNDSCSNDVSCGRWQC